MVLFERSRVILESWVNQIKFTTGFNVVQVIFLSSVLYFIKLVLPKNGRPRTKNVDRNLPLRVGSHPSISSRKAGVCIVPITVRRWLVNTGFCSWRLLLRLHLIDDHKQQQLEWTRSRIRWGEESVIFTDKSRIGFLQWCSTNLQLIRTICFTKSTKRSWILLRELW